MSGTFIYSIIITHGSPHQHIWKLMGGWSETGTGSTHCPCNTGNTASVPSLIIGDDVNLAHMHSSFLVMSRPSVLYYITQTKMHIVHDKVVQLHQLICRQGLKVVTI